MSIAKLSKFETKRDQIIKIARKINQDKSILGTIDGEIYKFRLEQGIIFISAPNSKKTINSEMSYDVSKGNSFNLALNFAIRVKIAMKFLIKGIKYNG